MVEYTGELEAYPGFETIVIGLEGFPRSGTIEPRAGDVKLGVT